MMQQDTIVLESVLGAELELNEINPLRFDIVNDEPGRIMPMTIYSRERLLIEEFAIVHMPRFLLRKPGLPSITPVSQCFSIISRSERPG
jgi:hypothetical protein